MEHCNKYFLLLVLTQENFINASVSETCAWPSWSEKRMLTSVFHCWYQRHNQTGKHYNTSVSETCAWPSWSEKRMLTSVFHCWYQRHNQTGKHYNTSVSETCAWPSWSKRNNGNKCFSLLASTPQPDRKTLSTLAYQKPVLDPLGAKPQPDRKTLSTLAYQKPVLDPLGAKIEW